MERISANKSEYQKKIYNSNGKFNGPDLYIHHKSNHQSNHSNNQFSSWKFQNNDKSKSSLKIDNVETLNPRKRQLDTNQSRSLGYASSSNFNSIKKIKDECAGTSVNKFKMLEIVPMHNVASNKIKSLNSTNNPIFQTTPNLLKGLDLMCWETKPKLRRMNEKYEVAYKNMIKRYPLIALFKCMGMKCSYTTDNPVQMLNHLAFHESYMKKLTMDVKEKFRYQLESTSNECQKTNLKLKELEELKGIYDYFLCCSYCQLSERDSKSLVHHINDIHRKDIYQCGSCFFRSCSKEICLQHCNKSHKKQTILIYECLGKKKHQLAKDQVMKRLLEKRKKFVVPLMCKVCNVGYYPLREFLMHCERDHYKEHEKRQVEKYLYVLDQAFKIHGYGMYQCLYCHDGYHTEDEILSHLIDHPSEFAYYCMRQPKESNMDPKYYHTLESTNILEIEKDVNVIEYSEDPELLSTRNYKNILDTDLQKLLN